MIHELKNKNLLIIDIETTDLPILKKHDDGIKRNGKDEYYNPTQLEKYERSRIISIGYIFQEKFNGIIDNDVIHSIIKVSRKTEKYFNKDAVDKHNITFDISRNSGIRLKKFLLNFHKLLEKTDYIVGHNILYDLYILASELYRTNKTVLYDKLMGLISNNQYFCTGEFTKRYRKDKTYYILSLNTFYNSIFNKNIKNCHTVETDIKAVADIIVYKYNESKNNTKQQNLELNIISFNIGDGIGNAKMKSTYIKDNIINKSYNIIFFQEWNNKYNHLIDKNKYIVSKYSQSHCGSSIILLDKKLALDIKKTYIIDGCIIIVINTNIGDIVLGSIHLFYGKIGREERQKQLEEIHSILSTNNLYENSILICGDTNMLDNEKTDIIKLTDAYLQINNRDKYITFPTPEFRKSGKYDYRYDRVFYNNCNIDSYETINTKISDHFLLKCTVTI